MFNAYVLRSIAPRRVFKTVDPTIILMSTMAIILWIPIIIDLASWKINTTSTEWMFQRLVGVGTAAAAAITTISSANKKTTMQCVYFNKGSDNSETADKTETHPLLLKQRQISQLATTISPTSWKLKCCPLHLHSLLFLCFGAQRTHSLKKAVKVWKRCLSTEHGCTVEFERPCSCFVDGNTLCRC